MATEGGDEAAPTNFHEVLASLERQVGEIADDLKTKSDEIESIIGRVLESETDEYSNRGAEKLAALVVRDAATVALSASEATYSAVQAVMNMDENASEEMKQKLSGIIAEVQKLIDDARGAAINAKKAVGILKGTDEPDAEQILKEVEVPGEDRISWRSWVVEAAKGALETVMAVQTAADEMTRGAEEITDEEVPVDKVSEMKVEDEDATEGQNDETPTAEGKAEPAADEMKISADTTDDEADKAPEPAAEQTSEPAAEQTSEPAAEQTSEPAAEQTSEPEAEQTSEPASEKSPEPVAETAPEPAAGKAPEQMDGVTHDEDHGEGTARDVLEDIPEPVVEKQEETAENVMNEEPTSEEQVDQSPILEAEERADGSADDNMPEAAGDGMQPTNDDEDSFFDAIE